MSSNQTQGSSQLSDNVSFPISNTKGTWFKQTVSSIILSTVATKAIFHPAELINLSMFCHPEVYKSGILNGIKTRFKNPIYLYRTFIRNTMRSVWYSTIQFTSREFCLEMLPQYSYETEFGKFTITQFESSILGALISTLITLPISETFDQLNSKEKVRPIRIFKNFGISSFVQIPSLVLYFGIYNSLKVKTPFYSNESLLVRTAGNFLIAIPSVMVSNIFVSPLNNIQRIILDNRRYNNHPRTLLELIKEIGKKEVNSKVFKLSPLSNVVLFSSISATKLVFFDLFRELLN